MTRLLVTSAIVLSLLGCGGAVASSPAASSGTPSTGSSSPTGTGGAGSGANTGNTAGASSGGAAGDSGRGASVSGTASSGSGNVSSGAGNATGSGPSGVDASRGDDAAARQDGAVDDAGIPATPRGGSQGCGKVPAQSSGQYVHYKLNVTTGLAPQYVAKYSARDYYVWLPTNYDPTRAYATVFLGPGCGGDGAHALPMQVASKTDAILVGLNPVGTCFMTSAADSPEIPFFDAAVGAIESTFCVERSRVFIAGFSSGSWLANLIGCARAGIVRGQGNASGGLPPIPACAGPVAAMLGHDANDPANSISGGMAARDRILKMNGCSLTDTLPYDVGRPSMCVQYKGCPTAFPVVWCPTMGQGHSDQVATGISVPGFWNFWKALP